jgi:hypothetical protein
MAQVSIRLLDVRPVMITLRARRPVMVVPEAGRHAHRGSQRDHTYGTEKNHSTREGGDRLATQAAVPHPACTHHHVDLQQESTQVRALHNFGFPRVRAERGSRSPRQCPHCNRCDVEENSCGEDCGCGADEHCPGPDQLKSRKSHEERAGRHPFEPVRRDDGEVNDSGAQRGQRREASCQPTVGPRLGSWCHSSDDDSSGLRGNCATSHLNRTEMLPSPDEHDHVHLHSAHTGHREMNLRQHL